MAGWEFAVFEVEKDCFGQRKEKVLEKERLFAAEISSFQVQLEKFSAKRKLFGFAEKAAFSVYARQ